MALVFLDTNVIIRYLTQDNPDHARRSRQLLQQLETEAVAATTSEAVIVELVYVLSSTALYNLPRREIRTHLTTVLSLPGLKLPHKAVYLRALDLYASSSLDFTDALNMAHMERAGITTIMSFDQHFDRVPGITRKEP